MVSAERQKAIALLEQKTALYEKLVASKTASKSDLIAYHGALEQLGKLQRVENSFQDVMYFAATYFKGTGPTDLLQEHTPSPPFHYELATMLRDAVVREEGSKFCVAAARSHAKSTIVSNIFLTWCIVFAEDINRWYWILLGDKQDTAKAQLAVVKYALEHNEKLREDFGALDSSKTWNSLDFITANGVRIQAAGAGEAIRGARHLAQRPNLLIDDLEGESDVSTPDQINKTRTWFNQTVLNLGDPKRSVYLMVGTILHYKSLLSNLINERPDWKSRLYPALIQYPDRMDLWDKWERVYRSRDEGETPAQASEIAGQRAKDFYEENREAMDAGAKCLWPERLPLASIMEHRATDRYAFSTELQCNPVDSETQVFKNLVYYDLTQVDLKELTIFGAVDPSLKETKRSDPSAILTLGKTKQGVYLVIDVDVRKRSPDQIIDDIFAKSKLYGWKYVSIETVAFQAFFSDEVRKRSAMAGLYLDVREFKSTVKKEIRITALEPLVTNGFIRFLPTQHGLLEQLQYFPKVSHDDAIDCLAQAVEMDRKRSGRGTIAKL